MKKNFAFVIFFAVLFLTCFASGAEVNSVQTNVYYFWQIGCTHCAVVEDSGILDRVDNMSGVNLYKLEIRANATSRAQYTDLINRLNVPESQRGTPLVVIEQNNKYDYLVGDGPVISNLSIRISDFHGKTLDNPGTGKKVTLLTVVIAALIDSINPCAFGVLAFLMISLLRMGSSKRALKAGLLYSFVVFAVYFLSGLGIFKVVQSFSSITYYVYLAAGILVLGLGLIQFIDFTFPGRFIQLRIPVKAKPIIERVARRGTLPAIVLLGVLVALFELPCTGGIYIGILTLMATNKSFAISSLLLYNLIFVLPLIVITLLIYKGTSPEKVERWSQHEKGWMKLASAIVMIALGIYILVAL